MRVIRDFSLLHTNIRRALLLIILAVLVPVLGLLVFEFVDRFNDALDDETQNDLEFARAVSTTFDGYVRDVADQQLAVGAARERQRRLLATELHDAVGQELVGLKLTLEHLLATVRNALPAPGVKILSDAVDKCVQLIREVRGVCHGLYPPALESFGLVTALKHLADGSPTPGPLTVRCDEDLETVRFANEVEIALYRIAQEAIHNALRHSRANHIHVNFGREGGALVLSVTDDGVGFDPAQSARKGLGFISMKERARSIGGSLEVASRPGETRIEVRVPLDHLSAAGVATP